MKYFSHALLFVFISFFMGCNFFSTFYSTDRKTDYAVLLEQGNEAINAGEYSLAVERYEKAMAVNPAGSEARFFHAKAVIKYYGLNLTDLKNEFNEKRENGQSGVPFIDSNSTLSGTDSIYYPIATAVQDLEHIIRLKKDTIVLDAARGIRLLPDGDTASDAVVSPEVATLDLGLLQAMKAMLAPIDLDLNLHLDSACGVDSLCKKGPLSEVDRFASYKKLTASLHLDSLSTDDMNAKDISTDPSDINGFLDAMLGDVTGADNNIGDAYNDILANDTSGQFTSDLGSMSNSLGDLGNFLAYMRYDDSTDNDYDAAGNSSPMVWYDYDRDGYITWDYTEDLSGTGYSTVARRVGHPLHRMRHPELYLTMDEFKSLAPELMLDTSANSRINQMIKRCNTLSEDLLITEEADASLVQKLKDSTCLQISAVIRPEIKPPAKSDWVSGSWGVDEETLDGIDNDNDGLTDEDSRNARTMDDDRDDQVDTSFIGSIPAKMLWSDLNANGCVDMSGVPVNSANPDGRENCIGTFENRLYFAANNPDTLAKIYSPMTNDDDSPDLDGMKECRDDMLRQIPTVSEQYTEAEQALACSYKHIWLGGPPSGSEWTGGEFGIDEEIKDGIDNDGDGWVDEDLK